MDPMKEISPVLSDDTFTIKDWIEETTYESKKIFSQVEIGDEDYVRLIFHSKYNEQGNSFVSNMYDTVVDIFGKQVAEDLLGSNKKMFTYSTPSEIETTYTSALSTIILKTNDPLNSKIKGPPKAPKRLYYGESPSFSQIVQNDTVNSPQNNSNNNKRQQADNVHATVQQLISRTTKLENENKKLKTNRNNDVMSTQTYKKIEEKVLESVTKKVDDKLEEKFNEIDNNIEQTFSELRKEHDEKIGNIRKLIIDTYEETKQLSLLQEKKAIVRETSNADALMARMQLLFQEHVKPPVSAVEQDSCQGDNKK